MTNHNKKVYFSKLNIKIFIGVIIIFCLINNSTRKIIIENFHDFKNYTLIKLSKKSSISKYNQFHIDNIKSIDKIILSDRNGNVINLKKKNNSIDIWIVNNKFNVRNDAIETLLSTANTIRIKKPVAKNAEKKVIDFIMTSGVNITFFNNDTKIQSYTIGSNTSNHLGNYMLLENTSQPFEVHIPTHNGFLSPRYGIQNNSLDINSWRSHNVFSYSANSIYKIQYTSKNNNNSYTLFTDSLRLLNYKNESIKFDTYKVFNLLNSFSSLNCESYKNNIEDFVNITPDECLIVNTDTLKIYHILNNSKQNNDELNFNVNRKYAILNNMQLMLIQDYVFNKVLININELVE
tara:strand:- start:3470 stop:4513 length:1044 start_codon:yes stop_codon:yes gene_type:complete